MKLLRYGPAGAEKPGLLDTSGNVRDLSAVVPDIAGAALRPDVLKKLQELDVSSLPLVAGTPQQDLRLGPCVGDIGKFICIGLNYADHAEEAGMPIPPEPVIFNKWTSAICGPNDPIQIPRDSVKTDWEVELGVVIGAPGAYIDEANAMDHVAGFCVINDVSEREFQLERAGTWDKGKGCDTFGPTGPWLVTTDEVADMDNLEMWLEVDGDRMQSGNTSTLIYKIPHLISYCSRFMSLQSGDVISTGTPPGVGMGQNPPRYLSGGEVVTLGIAGLGEQRSSVLAAL
ncbi:fumarylacetoacetate hydrolase family protein [Yoonia sediminilitoris]|uniref:2,4-diketo-3-deoxy-L-fuconate hydrolase n=1 Tax=Yoonia sediminilitoris TaxID=1286148 RepID=A0A2T6K9T9_9RHOB|nr:fumarylacetoacetate hydrolase family protein [Yoonia sediminilitoris]PUB11523.1 2,4-diketo-3-deoxy-L-fuconate hydrolase [Yoonia sediminilitoris]RCW91723.1 2,4-diketo-3-deoxy-L-fuconate hydrolase [Yoonia sediminilitoris]